MRELAANAFRRPAGEPPPSADIMSVAEACAFLSVHRNTLYKLLREGEIPAFRLTTGGRWKFRRRELEQWLEDRQARSVR
jgi:excisionase family DNA binding protein